ncbi:hypothetical protein NSU_3971 [Novosphingobium pentaromativorans US6-1]|uniref:Uncharacterized protein n=1 Tax=Novosphingobium pentaromativorans US6-1 TaxID=1088721 RepID=G6EI00_9SPHN|nr:hypothetical protein NSU_3971 [Novosphingobium pentaromativorans US6-1]
MHHRSSFRRAIVSPEMNPWPFGSGQSSGNFPDPLSRFRMTGSRHWDRMTILHEKE